MTHVATNARGILELNQTREYIALIDMHFFHLQVAIENYTFTSVNRTLALSLSVTLFSFVCFKILTASPTQI